MPKILALYLLLPAPFQPKRSFADLLRAIGAALMLGGAVSLLGGMAGACLKARKA